jgi:hypothetical protein
MEKYQQIISVEPDVTIVVRAHGNLDVHRWDRPELGIITDINVEKIRHENKLLRLLFVEDCELSVPDQGEIIIERVSENARVRDIKNPLTINKIGGKLAVQNVNSVRIGRVSEDCLLENIPNLVQIGRIGDKLTGKNLPAGLTVERVTGKVKLQAIGGPLEIRCEDSIEVGLSDANREKINIRCSDSILLHLPPNPDAALQIRSGGEKIVLETGEVNKRIDDNRCEVRLGVGAQKIVLDAGDRVRVTGEVLDEKEIRRLLDDLDALWLSLKEESEARRAAREKEVHWEIKMVEGAARIAQEAMNEVGEAAGLITQDAVRQAEIHVREAMKRVQEQIRNLGYDVWVDDENTPIEAKVEKSDVTVEEKLLVMRLLQEKKISVEEADRLLEVLSDTSR